MLTMSVPERFESAVVCWLTRMRTIVCGISMVVVFEYSCRQKPLVWLFLRISKGGYIQNADLSLAYRFLGLKFAGDTIRPSIVHSSHPPS